MNSTDESSAIETPPRRKKIHQRNNLKEGEEYQQIEVLESEVQVDSYIRSTLKIFQSYRINSLKGLC